MVAACTPRMEVPLRHMVSDKGARAYLPGRLSAASMLKALRYSLEWHKIMPSKFQARSVSAGRGEHAQLRQVDDALGRSFDDAKGTHP